MLAVVASELRQIVERTARDLETADPRTTSRKPTPTNWSAQEILGHLIDSASNNHQRFVRSLEQEALSFPGYEQDHWVRAQRYNSAGWSGLLGLWKHYNLHLADLIAGIPADKYDTRCRIGSNDPVTLRFLAEDYVRHLKHHVDQLVARIR